MYYWNGPHIPPNRPSLEHGKSLVGTMSSKFLKNRTSGSTLAKWLTYLSKDQNYERNRLRALDTKSMLFRWADDIVWCHKTEMINLDLEFMKIYRMPLKCVVTTWRWATSNQRGYIRQSQYPIVLNRFWVKQVCLRKRHRFLAIIAILALSCFLSCKKQVNIIELNFCKPLKVHRFSSASPV